MKNKCTVATILTVCCSILLLQCDTDKYFGYTFLDTLLMPPLNVVDPNTGLLQAVVPDCVGTGKLTGAIPSPNPRHRPIELPGYSNVLFLTH
jgi:hypothetical protein